MYKINKSTHEVQVDCKFCKKKIAFSLPENVEENKNFPFPYRYVHGEPYHSVTVYLDRQMNIRSTEFGDSLAISCEILHNCGDEEDMGTLEFKEQVLKSWITGFITTINIFTKERKEVLTRVGRILGDKYAKYFKSKDINGIIDEFQDFWKSNDFGFVKNVIKKDDQILFDIVDNLEVYYLPNMYKKLCFLTQGFLKVVLEKNLGKIVSIMETQCTAYGGPQCRFSIKWD
jgi:predicted hydrocarbon binding protein